MDTVNVHCVYQEKSTKDFLIPEKIHNKNKIDITM